MILLQCDARTDHYACIILLTIFLRIDALGTHIYKMCIHIYRAAKSRHHVRIAFVDAHVIHYIHIILMCSLYIR